MGVWEKIILEGFLGGGLAALGFACLFNIRGDKMWLAGLTGGAACFIYLGSKQFGAPEPLANLLASIGLSIISEILARVKKVTVTTFAVCALIPLVPGGTAYEMMVSFQQNNITEGLKQGVLMLSTSLMLALGIILVSNFTRFLYFSKDKIEDKAREILEK